MLVQLRVDTMAEHHAGFGAGPGRGPSGRRPTVMTPERVEQARRVRTEGKTFAVIGRVLGVGATSVSKVLG